MKIEVFPDNVPISETLVSSDIYNVSSARPVYIDQNLPHIYELVRIYSGGQKLRINSAHRKHVPFGGVKDSMHLSGDALDIALTRQQMEKFLQNFPMFIDDAMTWGLTGVGIYRWGVHIDVNSPDVVNWWQDRSGVQHQVRFWNKSDYISPLVFFSGQGANNEGENEADADGSGSANYALLALVAIVILSLLNR